MVQKNSLWEKIKNLIATQTAIVLIVVITLGMTIYKPTFLGLTNVFNIMRQMAITAFACYGILIVMATGNMDLSIGSNVAFAICAAAGLFKFYNVTNPIILILVIFVTTTVCSFGIAFLYLKLKMPATFIVSLAMNMAYRGFAYLCSDSATISLTKISPVVTWLGAGTIGGKFPVSFIFVIVICAVVHIFLRRTTLGRNLYFMGDNKAAARLAGINTDKTIMIAYTLSGFLAGFSALTTIGRVVSANPTTATMLNMDCIAGSVIGGAAFSGGKGSVWGAFAGTLLMTIINSALNFIGTDSYVQDICIGIILMFAVWLDTARGRSAEKARRLAQANVDKEAVAGAKA